MKSEEYPRAMSDTEPPDKEPAAPPQGGPSDYPSKGRPSFARLRRELSDEELSSPAVQKLLLDEIERLERDCTDLRGFRDRYYEASQDRAVLKEQMKAATSLEVLYVGCLTIGSAALAFSPTLWDKQPAGWIVLVFGIVLLAGALLTKYNQR
jgi:hypothetical protein